MSADARALAVTPQAERKVATALVHLAETVVDHIVVGEFVGELPAFAIAVDDGGAETLCGVLLVPGELLYRPHRQTTACESCLGVFGSDATWPARQRDLIGPERSEGPLLAPSIPSTVSLTRGAAADTADTSPANRGIRSRLAPDPALPAAQPRALVSRGGARYEGRRTT